MRHIAQIAVIAVTLSSCAYYEQAVGTAKTYYDAKASVWFDTACTLNVGALGRLEERQRDIVFAACPVQTAPKLEPE
ncbi:hypothetical protein LCGC14_2321100 [marine sediment metagenome]|uniref:Lipoprotein n=1 Tax=marine sediment metagenome TaxID=412755 RepID=A0A0F9D5A8_9ZZZZ